jgi:hypothetical protein
VIGKIEVPADPKSCRLHRDAAVRGRYSTEFWMNAWAVIALAVVLNDRLPVRLHHILASSLDGQLGRSPGCAQISEVSEPIRKRRAVARDVNKSPSTPFRDSESTERVIGDIEPGNV